MMLFFKNPVSQKILMAVTGLMLLLFVALHLIGNSSVFIGRDGLNAYAAALQGLGPLVWIFRLVMLAVLSLHIFCGIQLTLKNNAAKPEKYAVTKRLSTTLASRSMIWTGLFTAAFLVYHLLHFTFHATNPEISALINLDASGRPDVFSMVVSSFRNPAITFIYLAALSGLSLHLAHGIQSMFQTLGLNSESTFSILQKAGILAAIALFFGYLSIPVSILAGALGN